MKKLIGCETLMSMVMLGMFFFANSRVSFGIAIIAAFFVATIVVVIVGFISSLGAAFICIRPKYVPPGRASSGYPRTPPETPI